MTDHTYCGWSEIGPTGTGPCSCHLYNDPRPCAYGGCETPARTTGFCEQHDLQHPERTNTIGALLNTLDDGYLVITANPRAHLRT